MTNVHQLVLRGINTLDLKGPANWRSKMNLPDVRFGEPERSIPVMVCGSLEEARKVADLRFAWAMGENGFYAHGDVSASRLRDSWKGFLVTQKDWKFEDVTHTYNRFIKGLRFSIRLSITDKVLLTYRKAGKQIEVGFYNNLDSAKRKVRKMITRGEI